MRFRIAHLSDPHLPLPAAPSLAELASKRVFGYVNWLRNRRRALGAEILAQLVDDLAAQRPDHVCLTGDLVNIATPAELSAARTFLERLGQPERVSVVPGNHDAYVPGAAAKAVAAWAPWMGAGDRFPLVRRLGNIALISVSSAVATPPFYASGRVGPAQRAALAAALDRNDDAFKVVLIHHPLAAHPARGRRDLTDLAEVRAVLAAGCVDLVLHGHNHEEQLSMLETPRGPAAVVGVPSASSDGTRHGAAGYALIDIMDARMRITRRTIAEGRFRTTSVVEMPARVPLLAAPASPTRQAR